MNICEQKNAFQKRMEHAADDPIPQDVQRVALASGSQITCEIVGGSIPQDVEELVDRGNTVEVVKMSI